MKKLLKLAKLLAVLFLLAGIGAYRVFWRGSDDRMSPAEMQEVVEEGAAGGQKALGEAAEAMKAATAATREAAEKAADAAQGAVDEVRKDIEEARTE
jgi:signal transduction histidine kinase